MGYWPHKEHSVLTVPINESINAAQHELEHKLTVLQRSTAKVLNMPQTAQYTIRTRLMTRIHEMVEESFSKLPNGLYDQHAYHAMIQEMNHNLTHLNPDSFAKKTDVTAFTRQLLQTYKQQCPAMHNG